jgi:ATP phosphoribosyltransferase regulatory subunit
VTSPVRVPQGVRDRSPEHARLLEDHVQAIARTFELSGYDLVETPPFELSEVIERGLGDAAKKAVFRAVDPVTGEVLALRPDFTAQVARIVVARMSERPRPLRLRYQGRVLRAIDPHGRGLKSRDVYQAGIELYGIAGPWADLEVLAAGVRAVSNVDREVVIDLGHAGIVDALLPEGADVAEIFAALAQKDAGRLSAIAPAVAPLVDLYGPPETLARARSVLASAPAGVLRALDELEAFARAAAAALPSVTISIDLGEQRGLGYYTGTFFHGYVARAPDAVLLGGRYDELLARYGRAEPAVGLAIDVDLLARGSIARAKRNGVVFAERDPASPIFQRELEARRAAGEQAAIVPAERAAAYAEANGYRAVVEISRDGAQVEREVSDDGSR